MTRGNVRRNRSCRALQGFGLQPEDSQSHWSVLTRGVRADWPFRKVALLLCCRMITATQCREVIQRLVQGSYQKYMAASRGFTEESLMENHLWSVGRLRQPRRASGALRPAMREPLPPQSHRVTGREQEPWERSHLTGAVTRGPWQVGRLGKTPTPVTSACASCQPHRTTVQRHREPG